VTGNFTVTRNPLIKHLALLGKGIAWMPSFIVDKEIKSGSLVKILGDFDSPSFTFHLVYLYQKAIPFRQRCLIDFMKDWFSVKHTL
jgi:DNA-binding transcriptional LysR family regulator